MMALIQIGGGTSVSLRSAGDLQRVQQLAMR